MEELRETSIHHTALKFSEDIKQMKVYSNLFKTVQVSRAAQLELVTIRRFRPQEASIKYIFLFRNWRARPKSAKMT